MGPLLTMLLIFTMYHEFSVTIFIYFFKKWAILGLFMVYFQTFQTNSYNKSMWKNIMTIHYTAPGFKPTTFRTQVSRPRDSYFLGVYMLLSKFFRRWRLKAAQYLGSLRYMVFVLHEPSMLFWHFINTTLADLRPYLLLFT